MKKTRRKPKTKSGRRIAMDLLNESRCHVKGCGLPALETVAVDTTRGTKWKGFCWDVHRPKKKEAA